MKLIANTHTKDEPEFALQSIPTDINAKTALNPQLCEDSFQQSRNSPAFDCSQHSFSEHSISDSQF